MFFWHKNLSQISCWIAQKSFCVNIIDEALILWEKEKVWDKVYSERKKNNEWIFNQMKRLFRREKHLRIKKAFQARTKSFENVQKSDIKRVVLRSKLHKKYFVLIDFDKRDQYMNELRSLKSSKSSNWANRTRRQSRFF